MYVNLAASMETYLYIANIGQQPRENLPGNPVQKSSENEDNEG